MPVRCCLSVLVVRDCAGLDRARCPGHGPGLDRCIYVWLEHDDEKLVGVPRPCLNGNEVPPRACEHMPSCFSAL